MDLLKHSSPCFSRVFCAEDGLSKSVLRFSKMTDFLLKSPVLRERALE